MPRDLSPTLAAWAVVVLLVPVAFANADGDQEPTRDELLRRLEALEQRDAMRDQQMVDLQHSNEKLDAQLNGDWMTTARAEEIRNLVHDVLADADTRSSLMQDGMTAGWDEHFFLASQDGRFLLQLAGQMQARYIWNFQEEGDEYRAGFENTRTKLFFKGHVFSPDWTYLVEGSFSRDGGGGTNGGSNTSGGEFQLQDAWVRHHLDNQWSVRVGQFKLPFNREELVPSASQQVIERSLVNENTNMGRSQGIELLWHGDTWRVALATSDGGDDKLGGFGSLAGGTPENTPALDEDVEYSFTTRIEALLAGSWSQFADMTSPPDDPYGLLIGLAAHVEEEEFGTGFGSARDETRWFGITTDVSAEFGGANIFSSFVYHYIDSPSFGQMHFYGFVGQAGLYVTPKVEIYTRFEWGKFDIESVNFTDLYAITFGSNYYLEGHDIKLSADIGFGISQIDSPWDSDIAGWRTGGSGSEPQVVIRTQLQLLF